MDSQKVHIPFGCVLLTRSEILHGGYGGSKGSIRLCGTFHTSTYDCRENDVADHNYIVDPNDWQKYISEHGSHKARKNKPTSIVADETLMKEVGNIPTLLQTLYAFPKDFLDVLES